ncbi:c-type cytochrome [Haloglycomyces albus]|uniref:cytochrome bc1 complex diheme cytochrome c subunit n=1 Tax=Haloglycomyces albus TaxID=526067 RepID=UPI00046CBC45|nr:c-type cytochrome [Haloglycomyces albus]
MAATAKRRPSWRKRLSALSRFVGALVIVGVVYSVGAPSLYAQPSEDASDVTVLPADVQEGKELYDSSCITCHGANGDGIEGRGPSLIGTGSASVEFQVNTGRMPMASQGAQAPRKDPEFTPEEAGKIAAYIEYLGGGAETDANLDELVENADIAAGNELYRVNCSSCHGYAGGGGALSSGAHAPGLSDSTTEDIYNAMLTGPQNMPVFADNELTPEQKAEIIAYVEYTVQDDKDPGGIFNLGRFGPSTEGVAIFLVGITSLMLATLWIAGKS